MLTPAVDDVKRHAVSTKGGKRFCDEWIAVRPISLQQRKPSLSQRCSDLLRAKDHALVYLTGHTPGSRKIDEDRPSLGAVGRYGGWRECFPGKSILFPRSDTSLLYRNLGLQRKGREAHCRKRQQRGHHRGAFPALGDPHGE